MKRICLNRKGKTVRNVFLIALLLMLTWMVLGFPVVTAQAELRRGEQACLVDGFTLLTQDRACDFIRDTYGRRGNQFIRVSTRDAKLWSGNNIPTLFDAPEGILCIRRTLQDSFLLLGDVEAVASVDFLAKNDLGQQVTGSLAERWEPEVLLISTLAGYGGYDDWNEHGWTAYVTLYDASGAVLKELTLPL